VSDPVTLPQAVALMIQMRRRGWPVVGADGLDAARIQLMLEAPDGTAVGLEFELPVSLAVIQARAAMAMRPWLGANRNGFDRTGQCVRGQGTRELVR
jgi:hypothetical protein